MKKRFLSMLLAFIMVLTMIPLTVSATESENVYISVSYDGQFIEDKNGDAIAYVAVPMVELAAIELDAYGLGDFYYDGDGDGEYDVTALHLYIYTHEEIFGLDWNNVVVTGSPGSIFFQEGLFGFVDCNLNYYLNGAYPELSSGWGATADNLSLTSGDFYDIAGYSSWEFWMDSAAGFQYFSDENGDITHTYNTEAGQEFSVKLVRSGGGFGGELTFTAVDGCTVYYGTTLGTETGTVTTEDSGEATIPALTAGTWYLWCDGGYGAEYPDAIVAAPAYAEVTVAAKSEEPNLPQEPEVPREAQDISAVLNATMAQLASTVTAPAFGTNAGEWTVLSLARGEYFAKDNAYFTGYYERIVEYVNTKASSVNLNGALDKNKSTDNSRLILALSSIGKDAAAVGDWNLITPYEDFNWIKKQGTNGVIFSLIALDTNGYQTKDTTIRQQCIEYLLEKQLADGGWALSGTTFNTDITAMTLQALYPYRNLEGVTEAAEKAFARLSEEQLETGGFLYGSGETSESAAQVIVACTTWGINPDTDSRFVKSGKSAVDNLLSYYVEEDAMFAHQGNVSNAMATDQACYALVAYNRFINGKTALYDMSDVTFDEKEEIVVGQPKAMLGLPTNIANDIGKTFNATISLDQWDNTAGYKLMDVMVNVPEGLSVTDVTAGSCLSGGTVNYNLEEDTGKLRIVYFDANTHSDLTVSGTAFPAQFFTIAFRVGQEITDDKLDISIAGMSIKLSSDSTDNEAMIVVDTAKAIGSVMVVKGISYSAVCLYTGDDIDLIPSGKKAVAVAVTGGEDTINKLTYNDGTKEYEFKYSAEIHEKTGVPTYVALVDASIEMSRFAQKANFILADDEEASTITFGDANGDGVVNAQDALAAVDAWLRKNDAPSDDEILALNVNSDGRINTFDALGIVEAFVGESEYIILTKAANLNNK